MVDESTDANNHDVKPKRYAITFDPRATALIKKYAEDEQCTMADIIRKALNFYKLKRMAEEENMDIELVGRDKSGKERRIRVIIGNI